MKNKFNRSSKLVLSLVLAFVTTQFRPAHYQSVIAADSVDSQSHLVFLPIISNNATSGPQYYVDSQSGSDSNPGTTPKLAWKSLEKVQATRFTPDSVIYLKRDSIWTGSLLIRDSGQSGHPITFTAYGSGQPPILRNPGDATHRTKAVVIDADWVVVENFLIQDVFLAGVQVLKNSEHNLIHSVEVTQAGFGVILEGQNNLVTGNNIHDLHMVNNTQGGNDDYGAVGVSIENSFNEVSYNRFINCRAPSYDFGFDGGAVEWWSVADGVSVHHNWATGNAGFLEVGGGSARNAVVAYNVTFNNGRFAALHLSGQFGSQVENFRIENNTIVETPTDKKGWDVFWFSSSPASNTLSLSNNILYINWFATIANLPGFTHHHNLFYLGSGTKLNFDLGEKEIIADPAFVDLAGQNFELRASSPAINAGQTLGHARDFEGNSIPIGPAPDLGAFEYPGNP
jgi:hypothetical protein